MDVRTNCQKEPLPSILFTTDVQTLMNALVSLTPLPSFILLKFPVFSSHEISSLTQDNGGICGIHLFLSATTDFLLFVFLNWVYFGIAYLVLREVCGIIETTGEGSETVRNLRGGI